MLTSTTTTMLRTGVVARPCAIQPVVVLNSKARCSFSTTAHSPVGLRPKLARKSHLGRLVPRRHATTTSAAQQDAVAAAAVSAAQVAAHPDLPPLDWNAFFQLRKSRRRWQLACSIVTCATGGTLGALFLGSGAADPVVGQIPLDPFVTLGLMTSGFAALGWLAGPSIGSAIFYATKRKYKAQMTLVSAPTFQQKRTTNR